MTDAAQFEFTESPDWTRDSEELQFCGVVTRQGEFVANIFYDSFSGDFGAFDRHDCEMTTFANFDDICHEVAEYLELMAELIALRQGATFCHIAHKDGHSIVKQHGITFYGKAATWYK